jgi:hypothetical protein
MPGPNFKHVEPPRLLHGNLTGSHPLMLAVLKEEADICIRRARQVHRTHTRLRKLVLFFTGRAPRDTPYTAEECEVIIACYILESGLKKL